MNKNHKDTLTSEIVNAIQGAKGLNITILDLQGLDNVICDYFIICEGTSNTHIKHIASSTEKLVSKAISEKPFSVEGISEAKWVLLDYVDIVVHIFEKNIREHLDLESLWGDSKITNIKSA